MSRSLLEELAPVLADYEASRPRSRQRHVGPSEVGTPCYRRLLYKIAGVPPQRSVKPGVQWAAFQGTALHEIMPAVLAHWNRSEPGRWLAEERVHPIAGETVLSGRTDAYDTLHSEVVDWKLVGTSTLTEVRSLTPTGKERTPKIKPDYRVQAHTYGLGWKNAGRDVRSVRLVFLARTHSYWDSAEWSEPFDRAVADAAIQRYRQAEWEVGQLNLEPIAGIDLSEPGVWADTPHEVGDACGFCEFKRSGPADGTGCPGDMKEFGDGII